MATAIPVNPKEGEKPSINLWYFPNTSVMPAMAAIPPLSVMDMIRNRFTRMPAVPAADGLAPTARSWYPTDVFHRKTYMAAAMKISRNKAYVSWVLGSSLPNQIPSAISSVWAVEPSVLKGPLTR